MASFLFFLNSEGDGNMVLNYLNGNTWKIFLTFFLLILTKLCLTMQELMGTSQDTNSLSQLKYNAAIEGCEGGCDGHLLLQRIYSTIAFLNSGAISSQNVGSTEVISNRPL